jgi:hypothetical protein
MAAGFLRRAQETQAARRARLGLVFAAAPTRAVAERRDADDGMLRFLVLARPNPVRFA